ncbi:13672_t:CDS:2, partial [Cetraspora pellucida]
FNDQQYFLKFQQFRQYLIGYPNRTFQSRLIKIPPFSNVANPQYDPNNPSVSNFVNDL